MTDDLRPWIADAIELFGPDRLLVGSDWPVAESAGGYGRCSGSVIRSSAICSTTLMPPGCWPAQPSGSTARIDRETRARSTTDTD